MQMPEAIRQQIAQSFGIAQVEADRDAWRDIANLLLEHRRLERKLAATEREFLENYLQPIQAALGERVGPRGLGHEIVALVQQLDQEIKTLRELIPANALQKVGKAIDGQNAKPDA